MEKLETRTIYIVEAAAMIVVSFFVAYYIEVAGFVGLIFGICLLIYAYLKKDNKKPEQKPPASIAGC